MTNGWLVDFNSCEYNARWIMNMKDKITGHKARGILRVKEIKEEKNLKIQRSATNFGFDLDGAQHC